MSERVGDALKIVVPGRELFDEQTFTYIYTSDTTLILCHSLISLAKWESKWHVAYFSKRNTKTREQVIDYIRCMTINSVQDQSVYYGLSEENYKDIEEYLEDRMSATVLRNPPGNKNGGGDTITAELIYYWMISHEIPVEFQKWHINRLLALINVCNAKNRKSNKGKSNKGNIARDYAALNAERRARMQSKG